jgi:hypothetical protein
LIEILFIKYQKKGELALKEFLKQFLKFIHTFVGGLKEFPSLVVNVN